MKFQEGRVQVTANLPIKAVALRLGRTTQAVRMMCRRGDLRHWRDATGRLWSDEESIEQFLGPARGGMAKVMEATDKMIAATRFKL